MIEPFAAQELTVLVRFGQWPAILDDDAPARRLLVRLMELVQQPAHERPRGKLVALSWVLAPVEAKPARREAAPRKLRTR
jgi:hypothetical protein